MKKIYVLLSAACVAASASAVEKEMAVAQSLPAQGVEMSKTISSPRTDAKVKSHMNAVSKLPTGTRAAGEYAYFLPARNVMAIGSSVNGYAYRVTFGFASSYGDLVFNNYSTGASSFSWDYTELNDYELVDNKAVWNYSTSDAKDLRIKSGIGEIEPVELTANFDSGQTGTFAWDNVVEYVCGGGARFWNFIDDEDGEYGVSFYQNYGMRSPGGYGASLTYFNCYEPNGNGFNAGGAYVDPNARRTWKTIIEGRVNSEVSDIKIENFTFVQPEPASTYFITKAWINLNVEANAETQLISYIYPIDENGYITDTPIAIGYASISKGNASFAPVFEFYPLDEDGDEIEGEVFIDSAVAITVEGFAGNDAIKSISPSSGYYPFSYEAYASGNYDICRDADMYVSLSFMVDGQPASMLAYDNGLYLYDSSGKDQDTLSLAGYGMLTMDAVFPYIIENSGVDTVNIPAEGGSATVSLNALYYNIPALIEEGYYEVSAPDWLKVTFGEVDANRDCAMTVTAEAGGNRTGIVTIEGIGATYSLTVNQGDGNAVSSISIDKNAEYYDLQGRRVANPEKGLYIKKTANKTEKVIL